MYSRNNAKLPLLLTATLLVASSALARESNLQCQDLDIRSNISNSIISQSSPIESKRSNWSETANTATTELEDDVSGETAAELEDDKDADNVAKNAQLINLFNGRLPDYLRKELIVDETHKAPIINLNETDNFRTYLYNLDAFQDKSPLWEVGISGLYAQLHGCEYNFMYMHRYENFKQLNLAAGPEVNQETCLRQLTDLNNRLSTEATKRYSSKDIRLHQLLDTFGRSASGLLTGNVFWEGMYSQCVRLKMDYNYEDKSKLHGMHYCVAQVRHLQWPRAAIDSEVVSIRLGVCLPKSCDSLSYKNKYDLVKDLFSFNLRSMDRNQFYLNNIYCLPDEDSPARSVWNSTPSAVAVSAAALWIGFLVYATIRYEIAKRSHTAKTDTATTCEDGSTCAPCEQKASRMQQLYRSLSLTHNASKLFTTDAKSSLMDIVKKENGKPTNGEDAVREGVDAEKEDNIVDLSALEGIKVIAMCYVIMGHTLMCVISGLIDGREIVNNSAFLLANMVPAFSVNSFFGITGILTSYLLFKQNKSISFMDRPLKWVAFILFRYLRIMPLYLLAVAYSKLIAKYTNSGPIWDYGTSGLSQRRICEQESWLWTLLYGANFKKPLDHCIPGGWYLANDFQFFIVTPIFLIVLQKSPKWGKRLLFSGMIGGYLASFMSLYVSEVEDFIPIARFEPHGFKTYITNLHYNYTRPYYRIPAYLCGLFVGYLMHEFEQRKLEYRKNQKRNNTAAQVDLNGNQEQEQEPDWPEPFKKYTAPIVAVLLFPLCIQSIIATHLNFTKTTARLTSSFMIPFSHLEFAALISTYILLISTTKESGLLKTILSSSAWKPLSRLSLCAVLINVEVILYLVQGSVSLAPLTTQHLISTIVLSIISTYLASIFVCLLFEAPLRALLNHLLRFAMHKMKSSNKGQSQCPQETLEKKID